MSVQTLTYFHQPSENTALIMNTFQPGNRTSFTPDSLPSAQKKSTQKKSIIVTPALTDTANDSNASTVDHSEKYSAPTVKLRVPVSALVVTPGTTTTTTTTTSNDILDAPESSPRTPRSPAIGSWGSKPKDATGKPDDSASRETTSARRHFGKPRIGTLRGALEAKASSVATTAPWTAATSPASARLPVPTTASTAAELGKCVVCYQEKDVGIFKNKIGTTRSYFRNDHKLLDHEGKETSQKLYKDFVMPFVKNVLAGSKLKEVVESMLGLMHDMNLSNDDLYITVNDKRRPNPAVLSTYSDKILESIVGENHSLDGSSLPVDFKNFLIAADHQLIASCKTQMKLAKQNKDAGTASQFSLSMRDVEALRKQLLVTLLFLRGSNNLMILPQDHPQYDFALALSQYCQSTFPFEAKQFIKDVLDKSYQALDEKDRLEEYRAAERNTKFSQADKKLLTASLTSEDVLTNRGKAAELRKFRRKSALLLLESLNQKIGLDKCDQTFAASFMKAATDLITTRSHDPDCVTMNELSNLFEKMADAVLDENDLYCTERDPGMIAAYSKLLEIDSSNDGADDMDNVAISLSATTTTTTSTTTSFRHAE